MWAQLCSIVVGLWLMVAPAVLPMGERAAALDRIAGPVAVWVGVLALRDVTRVMRVALIPTGLVLLVATWLVASGGWPVASDCIAGALLIVFGYVRGPLRQRTGGGWHTLVKRPARVLHS